MGVRLVVAVVLLAVTAGGCAQDKKASPNPTASASPSASPSPSALPQAGECHQLRPGTTVDDGSSVPCTRPHNSLTLAVLQLPKGVTYGTRADQFYPQVTGPCLVAYGSTVGGTTAQRNRSVFHLAYVYPTDAQKAAGARYFRCDIVARGTTTGLLRLPAHGPFIRHRLPVKFAQCMNETGRITERTYVSCARPHRLRATGWYLAPSTLAWPGDQGINRLARQKCQPRARHRFFGWKPPTYDAWLRGERLSVCFLVDPHHSVRKKHRR